MTKLAVEMAQRGQVTLPKSLRDRYNIETGRRFTLLDLGGVFVLSPQESRVDALCDDLRDGLLDAGATLEDMLATLRARREGRAAE